MDGRPAEQLIDTGRLAEELKRRRRRLDISLEDIADETGISKSTLSRIERDIGSPDADVFSAVVSWLDLPFDLFVPWNRDKVVHFADADTETKIAATLYADDTLDGRAREALLDLMHAAIAHLTGS